GKHCLFLRMTSKTIAVSQGTFQDYIQIARPDHWFKNIFMIPGMVFALMYFQPTFELSLLAKLILGVFSTCLIASANYVINEWLDAEFDKFHPTKKNRPSVAKALNVRIVYAEYVILAI